MKTHRGEKLNKCNQCDFEESRSKNSRDARNTLWGQASNCPLSYFVVCGRMENFTTIFKNYLRIFIINILVWFFLVFFWDFLTNVTRTSSSLIFLFEFFYRVFERVHNNEECGNEHMPDIDPTTGSICHRCHISLNSYSYISYFLSFFIFSYFLSFFILNVHRTSMIEEMLSSVISHKIWLWSQN